MKKNPKFYIWGRATHVGQCYEGLCATTIASFIEQLMKEKGAVPVELCDLKPEYNVQTPSDAYVSFEYEQNGESASENGCQEEAYENMLEETAEQACKKMLDMLNTRREEYCRLCNIKYVPYSYDVKIIKKDDSMTLGEVREWFRLSAIKDPAIIVF